MITITTPYMSKETYKKIKESVLSHDAETFIKLAIDFYDKLHLTNSNWRMPRYVQIDDDWCYIEKEIYKYNPDFEPDILSLERDIWVNGLNGRVYFSTKDSKEMISNAEPFYKYKGRIFRLYLFNGQPRFCEVHTPTKVKEII